MRYRECKPQFWSLGESSQSRKWQRVTGHPAGAAAPGGLPVDYPNRETEAVLSGALKITEHVMIKRTRSYGSV